VAYTALSPHIENEGGTFLYNFKKCKPKTEVYDVVAQRKLMEASCNLLGIPEFIFATPSRKDEQTTEKYSSVNLN